MIYIKVLEEFQNIHNKNEIYHIDEVKEITKERYEEIIKNMNKLNKKLVKKATKKEIDDFLNGTLEQEEVESTNEVQND